MARSFDGGGARASCAAIVLVVCALACGCGPGVADYTRPSDATAPIHAQPDAVTLVVMRAMWRSGEVTTIVDEQGTVLAQLAHHTHTVITLSPGAHELTAIAGDGYIFNAFRVDGVAGRVYYAYTANLGGPTIVMAARLDATDEHHRWQHREEHVSQTTRVELDTARLDLLDAQLPLARRLELVRQAHDRLEQHPEAIPELSLAPDDGIVP